eukprot:1343888-Amorphochlora_amoeboformis.AAC.2
MYGFHQDSSMTPGTLPRLLSTTLARVWYKMKNTSPNVTIGPQCNSRKLPRYDIPFRIKLKGILLSLRFAYWKTLDARPSVVMWQWALALQTACDGTMMCETLGEHRDSPSNDCAPVAGIRRDFY